MQAEDAEVQASSFLTINFYLSTGNVQSHKT